MQPASESAAPRVSTVIIRRGSIYLAAETCERYFHGLESVILQRQEDDLLILPVRHSAAGGYLLKIRNSAGDRVVNALDFFAFYGLASEKEISTESFWNSDYAALHVMKFFGSAK
jgi:hypothetical protein